MNKQELVEEINERLLNYSHKEKIIDRVLEIVGILEEENNGTVLSIESFRNMINFLNNLGNYNMPRITINDDGRFGLRWVKSENNKLILSFRELYVIDFLMFQPSSYHILGRNTLTGTFSGLNFSSLLNVLVINTFFGD